MTENADIRAWADANGLDCPARGRIPADVREAYAAAQADTPPSSEAETPETTGDAGETTAAEYDAIVTVDVPDAAALSQEDRDALELGLAQALSDVAAAGITAGRRLERAEILAQLNPS